MKAWTPWGTEAVGWWSTRQRVLGIGAWLVVAVITISQGHRAATTVAAGLDLHQVIVAGQALRSGQAPYQVHPAALSPAILVPASNGLTGNGGLIFQISRGDDAVCVH